MTIIGLVVVVGAMFMDVQIGNVFGIVFSLVSCFFCLKGLGTALLGSAKILIGFSGIVSLGAVVLGMVTGFS